MFGYPKNPLHKFHRHILKRDGDILKKGNYFEKKNLVLFKKANCTEITLSKLIYFDLK